MKRGKYLTRLRLKAGLSQNDVAEKLNYSPQLVSLWEKDKSDLDLRIVSKYAKLLNVDLKSFILLKDKKRNNNCVDKEFDINKFSNNLRFLRKDRKLLQSDIAKKTKTNVKTVGSWESGASTPTIDNFIILCSIFNKSFDELYFVYTSNEEEEHIKRKKLIPIFIPIVVLLVGGTTTGITIGVTSSNKKKENNSNENTEHVHKFSTSTKEATYDHDGLITYTCECGYSYTETIPQLIHKYSENYSYNNHYHYRPCIDEGYEDLFIDKEAHDIHSHIEGDSKTYSCSMCDFSYTTEDYITVVDLLDANGEPHFSASNKNEMYLKILNANKYEVKDLGYRLEQKDDPNLYMEGSINLSGCCLDVPDYTLFTIDYVLFTAASDLIVPGNIVMVTFKTTSFDPDLLSVECEPLDILITE